VGGEVIIHNTKTAQTLNVFNNNEAAVRTLSFTKNGHAIFTASTDGLILKIDMNGKLILRKKNAHVEPINIIECLDDNLIVSGCDGGLIKIWDNRTRKCVIKYSSTDYISDLLYIEEKHTILSTSGDGKLCVFDLRKKEPFFSECQDDELVSITSVRNHEKICVGTSSGTLLIFSYGNFGDCTDRFTKHKDSINRLLPRDDGSIYTASDGQVRILNMFPNKFNGVIAKTEVEFMSLSPCGKWISTCGHDEQVKLFDTFAKDQNDQESSNDSESDDSDGNGLVVVKKKTKFDNEDIFAGLD
jgi:WD40 repeat protein